MSLITPIMGNTADLLSLTSSTHQLPLSVIKWDVKNATSNALTNWNNTLKSDNLLYLTKVHEQLPFCPEDMYTEDQIAYRVYANMPIGMFGIISNILNIFVFCDEKMRTVLVNHFLLALSISDLFLLLCNFFFLILPVIVVVTNSFFWNDIFPVIIHYSYPLALTAQTSGVYLTVLVSVHRFLGVCFPFRTKRWITKKPVQYAIIGSMAFSIIINIPTWLELGVMKCYSHKFNCISRQITLASFHNTTYILIKKTVVYTLVMFIVPFTILITVNWRIILALKESSNLRTLSYFAKTNDYQNENSFKQFHLFKNSKYTEVFHTFSKINNTSVFRLSTKIFKNNFTNSTRDRSVTLMLLAIVALFLTCNGLAFCNSIVESIMLVRSSENDKIQTISVDGTKFEENEMQQLIKLFECSVEISNLLITLNSSTSTLVYLIFSTKYRLVVKSIIKHQKPKKVNRVVVTTALAAHRAIELSLIPKEIDSRKRKKQIFITAIQRAKLFQSQTTPANNILISNSESNLRLMDNENKGVSTEEKSKITHLDF